MFNQDASPKITLEQWAAFRAVVEEGSYARAAETLNKSQSTVSYAITKLNELLPQPALMIKGRKAELTDLGQKLYRQACHLLDQALWAEELARTLAQGWEKDLTLVADALLPMPRLFAALHRFSSQCATTRIKILETSLSGTDEALLGNLCDLALTPRVPPGFLGEDICTVTMLPVAQQDHPLAQLEVVSEADLRLHRQIVVRDTGLKREQDAGWLGSEKRWTVTHFASTIEALLAGLGFAFIPQHKVARFLESGELKVLSLQPSGTRHISMHLVQSKTHGMGPAAQLLAAEIRQEFQTDDRKT